MALSLEGWLLGISSILVLISCWVIGIFEIYKSKTTNAKLLFYIGFGTICSGLLHLGFIYDFFTVLFTGSNMDNSYGLHGILGFMWIPIFVLAWIYVLAETNTPRIKWHIMSVYIIISILYEIFLFIDPLGSFNFVYPTKPGEDLIDDPVAMESPFNIMLTLLMLPPGIFFGFALIHKSLRSTGVIRKKLLLFALSLFLILISGLIDGYFINLGILLFFTKIGIVISYWISYLALREEPEKDDKVRPKKETKVESGLFRISQIKREDITEEEVSISKEKKICLVCKGKVGRFMYMCPECETFYCDKCARALIELENACWACITPIDKSRPVKPFKKEEEVAEIEISEKSKK